MTRIDFYLLAAGQDPQDREKTVCRLTQKAYQLGHRIYIFSPDTASARAMDNLLWTFNAGSFVPHQLNSGQGESVEVPVLIGTESPPNEWSDVLINMAPEVPSFFSRFGRVAEVVSPEEDDKRAARERFRFYRDRGYSLNTHDVA